MRKLWQAVMETRRGLGKEDIFFDVTDTSSPYGEATLKNVYSLDESVSGKIAVNPFYSHQAVFQKLIKPGKVPELTVFVCDLILHHLAEIDALEGMDLEEFYVRFLEEDIDNNAFGVMVNITDFTEEEKRRIAYYYLRLCRTGNYEACFCNMLQKLYRNVWVSTLEDENLLIVIGRSRTETEERKLKSLQNLFLRAGQECRICWNTAPCIIGCKETPIGGSILY